MSPLTAKVKCPHYGRRTDFESEAVEAVHLLRMVLEGHLSLREASDRMEVSYCHAQWLKGVVAQNGPRKLTYGNTGRRPANAIGIKLRQKIVELSRTEYGSFNDTHFTEKLSTVQGIRIRQETGRKIRGGLALCPRDEDVLLGIGSAGFESLSRG